MTVIKLPFPDASLFPNRKAGTHWTATKAAKDKARDDAYTLTKAAKAPRMPEDGTIPLSIVFIPPDGRLRDLDNCLAALKPALDGLALALGVDDRRFRPILLDVGEVAKPGAVVIGVGVQIVTTSSVTN